MFTSTFDNYGHPRMKESIVVKIVDEMDTLFIVDEDGKETKILTAARDQWGVYFDISDKTIAQEDGTISFIDALIKGLQYIKDRNEFNTIAADIFVEGNTDD